MYKNSAFIGSQMVLIYFCSTLHTAQGKSPNTFTSYNYRHFQWYFGLAALTSIAANLQLFSVYLDICSVRKHACKFAVFCQNFGGGEALPPMYRALCHVSERKLTREVAVQHLHRKYNRVRGGAEDDQNWSKIARPKKTQFLPPSKRTGGLTGTKKKAFPNYQD